MSEESTTEEQQPESPLSFAPFFQAISGAMDGIANYCAQVMQQVMPAIQQIAVSLNERYQEAGAPYGDTQEGMWRWLKDMAEINQKRQEIERMLQYHEMMIDARKLGEKMRAKHQEDAINEIAQLSQDLGMYD